MLSLIMIMKTFVIYDSHLQFLNEFFTTLPIQRTLNYFQSYSNLGNI